jgi:hypothetical protein
MHIRQGIAATGNDLIIKCFLMLAGGGAGVKVSIY